MACLALKITPIKTATVTTTAKPAAITVTPAKTATVTTTPQRQASVTTAPVHTAVNITSIRQMVLTIGEVCTISGGVLAVLASTEGPLRTKAGGYILLAP